MRKDIARRQGRLVLASALISALAACGGGGDSGQPVPPPGTPAPGTPPPAVSGPAWSMYGGNAQHSAQSGIGTPQLTRILWQTPVDLAPQYAGGKFLLTHYGSPLISSKNTVIVPVKVEAQGTFRVEGRHGANGALMWTISSDYVPPPHNWFPSFNAAITTNGRVYAPGIGGRLLYFDDIDSDGPRPAQIPFVSFYGNVGSVQAELDATLMVSTPLTVDALGDVFFGFYTTAANSAAITSGVARIAPDGSGTWAAATSLANDATIDRVAMNAAPALSTDGSLVYVAVSSAQARGYLLALDSTTLAVQARVALTDPSTGAAARIVGDSTASPTVGPDGDVYFGVLESNAGAHNSRGWLLHFNGALSQTRTPGSFGWDDTATIVPSAQVPAYTGASAYLLATKYNNYMGAGSGDGQNRMAILDPNGTQADPVTPGVTVMKEVITILGPTADSDHPGGVREWCVNTAAYDPYTHSMLVNNEDGYMYRWDLATNTLSQKIRFNNGLGQSYTPTAVGADGTLYAINNAVLFAVGQ